jgi:hypothetical protein
MTRKAGNMRGKTKIKKKKKTRELKDTCLLNGVLQNNMAEQRA